MSENGSSLVLLTECGGVSEASVIRGLLQSNGIEALVQGEQHASLLGATQVLITPRVLVPAAQLEQARQLLAAHQATQGPQPDGETPLDGVCAVHEKPATTTCGRCGNFLCADCKALGSPALCESCVEVESAPVERRAHQASRRVMMFTLALMAIAAGLPLLASLVEWVRERMGR